MDEEELDRRLKAMSSFTLDELNWFELNARRLPSVQIVCDLAAFALGMLQAAKEDGEFHRFVELYKRQRRNELN